MLTSATSPARGIISSRARVIISLGTRTRYHFLTCRGSLSKVAKMIKSRRLKIA
jgi:hypothetical protein